MLSFLSQITTVVRHGSALRGRMPLEGGLLAWLKVMPEGSGETLERRSTACVGSPTY